MRRRSHSMELKRQGVQEYLGRDTLRGLAKRHDVSRQLIRVWIEKYETGEFDDEAQAADLSLDIDEDHTKMAGRFLLTGGYSSMVEH